MEDIVACGPYSSDDRDILLNVERIPEIILILAEEKTSVVPYPENVRTDQRFIDYVNSYHKKKMRDYGVITKTILKYFNWKIVMKNGREELILEFPWEELAKSYIANDIYHPLRQAIENGEIKIIDT